MKHKQAWSPAWGRDVPLSNGASSEKEAGRRDSRGGKAMQEAK